MDHCEHEHVPKFEVGFSVACPSTEAANVLRYWYILLNMWHAMWAMAQEEHDG